MFTASLVFTAEACCKLGDAERARTLYALLLPYADQAANHPRAACLGVAALYLGMLARTFGDADNARKHFDAALASHRAMNAWPWLARTELHYGALLVALESPADQAAGRELLRDAEQLASRLSMITLVDEIGTLPRARTRTSPSVTVSRLAKSKCCVYWRWAAATRISRWCSRSV